MLALALVGCHDLKRAGSRPDDAGAAHAVASSAAEYDNHEQVWRARESGAMPPPHVVISVEPTSVADVSLWRVHLDANPKLDAVWAMRRADANGAVVMTPMRATVAAPSAPAAFDAGQWTPLDACALRGDARVVRADAAACSVLAPGVGPEAALLPLQIEQAGELLRVRLYADQARGADAREEARRVQRYAGWAAVNGGGPKAAADSSDWHMNRDLRLGNEGGRAALAWRDGSASGYSLALERLTYRDGNVPVLKLSIIDDASGRTLAYAWANPEATRIGINLGWVQVGLSREDVANASAPK